MKPRGTQPYRRHRCTVALGVVVLTATATGCALVSSTDSVDSRTHVADIASVAGWTRIATSKTFLVIANVLPAEEMYTPEEFESEHPTEGEIALHGGGAPTGPEIRHVEAHVYDRLTGTTVEDADVVIVVVNQTSGERTEVDAVVMQDVNIGPADLHFGNNVRVPGATDLRLEIVVDGEEVTFDGFLA
jgi:hypothetical protein